MTDWGTYLYWVSMSDPFSSYNGQVSGIYAQDEQHARWISAYSQGIVLPDVTIADRKAEAVVTGVFSEDGQPLDLKRRQEIAASRRMDGPDFRQAEYSLLEGETDLDGRLAVSLRPKGMRFVRARPLDHEAAEDARAEQAEAEAAHELEQRMNKKV